MAAGIHKKVLITGANGFVARQAIKALRAAKDPGYELYLVDKTSGEDEHNRFAIEDVSQDLFSPASNKNFCKVDLTDKEAFAHLLTEITPDAVLHCAGVLENQSAAVIRAVNPLLNGNVLGLCAERGIPVIPMSSIMVMYGLAVQDPEIAAAFRGDKVTIPDHHLLTAAIPLDNGPLHIQKFNPDKETWQKNLAYIQTKEKLENLAQDLCVKHPKATIIPIRLGWTGMKNPYELEPRDVPYTESTVYLDPSDLRSFLQALMKAVIMGRLPGYHCYFAVSEHPQRWISLYKEGQELKWAPKVNIAKRYGIMPQAETTIWRSGARTSSEDKAPDFGH